MSFVNKVVIVTGASSGIGADAAKQFASEGAKVVLVGRNEQNLKAVQAEFPSHSKSLIIRVDVRQGETTIIKNTLEAFGQIDVLVNNAGILQKGSIETTSIADFDEVLDINLRSVYKLTQKAIPHLAKTKGNIVNVSSIAGTRSFPNIISYCVSKAALDQFTKCAALELAEKGIRVNAVNPGTIQTDIHRRSGMNTEEYEAYLERCRSTHALGRVGHVNEVSSAILFLAGETASFITGCCLVVDGGKHVMCN